MSKLPREFYQRDTRLVAKELLGHHLVHCLPGGGKIAKIVEVEAYLGSHDLACHSSKGLTKRTATMFGPPGHAYIYMIYGMYYCFNIVTEPEGVGAAVLIRAVEPVANISERTQGPGLLSRAMRIDKQLNGSDLLGNTLYISDSGYEPPREIIEAPRIGVAYAREWAHAKLRFYIKDNVFISKR